MPAQRLIDRLLADPRYGEQQARHWLDVVRYADTSGFSNDVERPNAWRYRDYVIRSFNSDKPYDRFVTEQLAGDELDPNDPEMLIAVGFLRMGPWEHTQMTVAAVTRQQFLDDVTHNVGVSLLGQGLRCASCHDHKFDPIPTRDYYRLQAIFAPCNLSSGRRRFWRRRMSPVLRTHESGSNREWKAWSSCDAGCGRSRPMQRPRTFANGASSKLEDLPPDKRPPGGNFGNEFGLTKTEQSLQKMYEKNRLYLERELERFEPNALSLYDGTDNGYLSVKPVYAVSTNRGGVVPAVHILAGGSLESPLDAVTPGVLSAMAGANDLEQAHRLEHGPRYHRRPPAGARQMDRQPEQHAHGPRDRQPHLAAAFRQRHRRDAQQLRLDGRPADASGAARLARHLVHRPRLVDQTVAPT